jgi:hypothetical protein
MKLILAFILSLALVGCATNTIQIPEQDGKPILTQAEVGLIQARARLIGARNTINTLAAQGVITPADRMAFHNDANKVRASLDLAEGLPDIEKGKELQVALTLLLTLRGELAKRTNK